MIFRRPHPVWALALLVLAACNGSLPEPRYVEPGYDPTSQEESEPQEQPRTAARARPSGDRTGGDRRSLSDSGMRDFREVVSEANELGGASARATR